MSAVPTTITVLVENPADEQACATAWPDVVGRARAVPGVQGVRSAVVWPKEDGSATPAHRLLELGFASYEDACAAVTTAEAGAFFPALVGAATGGFRVLFTHDEV